MKFSSVSRIAAIQLMWATDEYATIFRNCVWLSPPHPPSRTDVMADVRIRGWLIREDD